MIFSWVANDGYTLRHIVRELLKLGISPRKSKRGVWNTSTLSNMLRHEVYIGKTHWGASYAVIPRNPLKFSKYKRNKKTSRILKEKNDWVAVITSVPTIIDPDTFKRAGEQLKKNYEQLGRNKKNDYLLAGRIYCTCGHRRAGEGPQKGKHLYYRCTNRVHSFPLPPTCIEKGINARIADEIIWTRITKIFHSPELLSRQAEKWFNSRVENVKSDSVINVEKMKNELTKLRSQEDRLAILCSQNIITMEKFKEYVDPVRNEITKLENKIRESNLEKVGNYDILLPSKDEIESFAKESAGKFENLNFAIKQMIIRQTVNKIITNRESLQVYGHINFNEINVVLRSEYRHSWPAQCRKIDALQRAYKKISACGELSLLYH